MKRTNRLTIEHLWKLQRPAQPSLSPDAAQACVSVTAFDMAENKGASALWLFSAFGGAPRQLTAAGEKDAEPRWSPDGRWIAFVAKRPASGIQKADEEPQLYLIAPDGGEARRVTDIATGVFGIKWFPDSRRIAFLSWVWPEEKGVKALAKRYRKWKDDPVKAHVVEHSAYRWWDKWLTDGRTVRLFTVDIDGGAVRDLLAGTKYELARADPTAHLYDIAPDGREIVFSFDPAQDKRFDHEYQLVALDMRKRRFRTLTRNSPLNHETPRYSPDGRWIALITQNLKRSHIDTQRLALIDRRTGKMTVATPRWDRSVHPPLAWSGDSSSVHFVAEEDARQHLWRFEIGSRRPQQLVRGGVVSDFDVAGDAVVFVRNNMSTPPAVFWRAPGMAERRIDALNKGVLDGVKLGEVREFRFKGFDGDPVQMWAIYPPDFDPKKKWPLLHNIHGGPHATWGDHFHFRWNNHTFAAQGYVVVCVNYHGSSSFGQKYMESIVGEMGRREFHDVERGTDFMLKQGYIDRERLVAAGGSYGGYMVAWMNGHTDRYKAYVCHAGVYDWAAMSADDAWYWGPKELRAKYWDDPKRVAAQNPMTFAHRMKTPTLVVHGLLDYRVPDAQGLAYYDLLKAKEVPTRLVFFPDENHWILKPRNSQLWYREFFSWLRRWVEAGGKARARR